MNKTKTLVVGLGEVGSALVSVLRRSGPVLEHDIEPRPVEAPIGVMHLCFPCSVRSDFEEAAVSYIRRFKPQLTIVNSTVVPGTTRAIAARTGAPAVYSPIRGKHAHMVQDLLRYEKFVAASDPRAARRAEAHFRRAGMRTRRVKVIETLELAKLAETTYFGVLIAFAQELNRYASAVGGDYDEAIGFFDEIDFLPRTRYFPGVIGGHCVIPNIHLLQQVERSVLLQAVLESNRCRMAEVNSTRPLGSVLSNGRP